MDNFDLKKYLIENKATRQSRIDEMEDETGYGNVSDDELMDMYSDDELMAMYNEMAKSKYNMSIHVANQFVELEKEARKRGLLKNFDNFPNWF